MKIDNRQKLLSFLAIGAVVLWAATQLILTPLYGSWDARQKRIAKLRQDVADGNVLLKSAKSTRDRWNNEVANTLTREVASAESQLLKAFQRWNDVSNVTISSKRQQWRKGDDESYATLECRADISGGLDGLTRLLYAIENDPLGVKVETVDITAKDASGAQLSVALEIGCLQLLQTNLVAQAKTKR